MLVRYCGRLGIPLPDVYLSDGVEHSTSFAWHRHQCILSIDDYELFPGAFDDIIEVVMAHDVVIRPARPDEHTMLESLQRRASLSNPGDRDALVANPDAIELPLEQIAAGYVFVAERYGVAVGFAAVVPRPGGDAELDALFVEPHFWKRGIGRRLVEHVADVARVRAASFLHVVGNPHAEAFYRSCGFEVTGTIETRFGVGLLMRRPLVRPEQPT